jgi:uncharacterized metal-binding protein
MLDKRGQVGETITWIVATVIIVVTLVIFIFVSVLMADVKEVIFERRVDWISVKTLFAHLLTEDENKEVIDDWIEDEKKMFDEK